MTDGHHGSRSTEQQDTGPPEPDSAVAGGSFSGPPHLGPWTFDPPGAASPDPAGPAASDPVRSGAAPSAPAGTALSDPARSDLASSDGAASDPALSRPAPPDPRPPDAGPPYAGPSAPGASSPHPPAAAGPQGPGEPPPGLFGLRPDPPAPRTGWAVRSFLIAEAVFLGVSVLVAALVGIEEAGIAGILVAIVVPTVVAALAALVLTRWKGNGPRIDLGMRWRWDDVAVGTVVGLAGLVLTVPAALIYAWVVGPEGMTTAVADVFGGLRTSWPVALLVMAAVVIVAPICEEILYRGLLWRAVAKHVSNRWLVFLITTVVFAFAHFELTRTPLLFVVALPLGLARLLTGRLTAGVIAHQINNFLPGLALALMLTGVVPAPA